jgi:hypothetical protein
MGFDERYPGVAGRWRLFQQCLQVSPLWKFGVCAKLRQAVSGRERHGIALVFGVQAHVEQQTLRAC